ncbi:MAG: hypothetical protein ACLFU8_05715 [Anaerolineales bacterium]
MASCAPQARTEGYAELAAWLEANALPDERVAVQEPGAWTRLTGLPLVGLPADADTAALLESLAEQRPDYCVALRSVAWEGVQASPWFRERYRRVASTAAVDDPLAPLSLYRYHPSPFEGGETLPLGLALQDESVGHIAVDSVRLTSQRLEPGEPVYVSLTLSGDVRESLRVEWLLRDAASGRVWLRDAHAEPGGRPTDAWPVRGAVTERHVIAPPADLPPGDYALELAFTRPNLALFGEPVRVATLTRPPDVSRTPLEPDHPLDIGVGDVFTLAGYDAPQRLAPGDTLRLALHWQVQDVVTEDLKVFVHLFDSEGIVAAQSDGVPVGWSYPTTLWQPGETVRDVHVIPLDAELPRGDYRVLVGMYDPVTGERLLLRDAQGKPPAEDAVEIFVLRVR